MRTASLPKSSWNLPAVASSLRQQTFDCAPGRLLLQILFSMASVVLGLRTFQQMSLVVLTFRYTELDQNSHKSFTGFIRVQDTPGFPDIAFMVPETKKAIEKVQQTTAQFIPEPAAYNWNSSGSNFSTTSKVGRHKILVREWPHPDATETMKGFNLIARVQLAQRLDHQDWKPVIVITPTHARLFQAFHLTGLMHTLSLVRGPVIWIVVEAGGRSQVTAELLKQAHVHVLVHVGYPKPMPVEFEDGWIMESHMRVEGLRFVREKKLEGVVIFADDSNVQSMEFFNLIQKTEWVGIIPMGILGYAGFEGDTRPKGKNKRGGLLLNCERKRKIPPKIAFQVQTVIQNSNGTIDGWHVPGPLALDCDLGIGISYNRMQWAGFVMNAQAVWGAKSIRSHWLKDWKEWTKVKDGVYIDLRSILKDESKVEVLGKEHVQHWWIRIEGNLSFNFCLE